MRELHVVDDRAGARGFLRGADLLLGVVIKALVAVVLVLVIAYGIHHWF